MTEYHIMMYFGKWDLELMKTVKDKLYWLLYGEAAAQNPNLGLESYWIATPRSFVNPSGYITYGLYNTRNFYTATYTLSKMKLNSATNKVEKEEGTYSLGVRPVVLLQPGVELTKVSDKNENGATYKVWNIVG